MKNRKAIRFQCLCLILTICAAMIGCTESKNPAVSGNTSLSENDGALTAYAEPVTMTQARSVNPNITFIEGESVSDNFVSKMYKEKLNIIWQDKWTADPAAYTAKLNLDIASDELPDVCNVSATQLCGMVAAGQAMDLTEIYNQYASEKLKANISDKALQGSIYDGKIYGLPLMTSQESDTPLMWLRTDWMHQLGFSAPTTYEELVEYLKALKDSGLISSGSAGMNFYGPGSQSFSALAQTQKAYYNTWLLKNGKLVYSGIQDEMRDALLMMQNLYKDGLIDQDFAIKGSTEESLIAQGQYGIVFGQFFYGHLIKGSLLNNKDATWSAYAIPKNTDGLLLPKSSTNVSGYYAVRSQCEHPEALVKSMNLWMEVWSEDGLYRNWFTEKMTSDTYKDIYLCGEYALPSFFDVIDNNIKIGVGIRAAYATGDPDAGIKNQSGLSQFSYSFITRNRSDFYKFVGGEGWALNVIYTTGEKVFSDDYKNYQYDEFNGVLSEDSQFFKASLDTTMIEKYFNIIMGEDINTFDKFVTEWKKNGGDEITEEVNQWYASLHS